jgi:hypothetical protein
LFVSGFAEMPHDEDSLKALLPFCIEKVVKPR